ncbi:RDD family protein [Streptomyces sp. NBC_01261]|uniref:RDD family protein n=1 Tax=unclassified Streptomyces TaxID=2593676 RepID=UPI002E2E20C8|nr:MULTISPECIES: RDD family protein [unclassified Streptomyces]
MSAPTPAPGDDRPREGYYPDPSIPGYVRYWNGAAWVPGTSRPAPSDGLPPGAPGASVEETGPHFFDEDPAPGHQVSPAQAQHGSRPEPAAAWGADRAHQSGFGGDQDRRVSWGSPDPRTPADPRVPVDSPATVSPEDPPSPGTFVFRRPTTGGGDTPSTPRTPQQGGALGAHAGGAGDAGGFGPHNPVANNPVGNTPSSDPSGPGFGAGKAAAARAAQAQAGQAGSGSGAAAPVAPSAASTALSGPQQAAPGVPQQSGPAQPQGAGVGMPMAAGPGGGQPSWAQQVHRLAGDEDGPVAPWKPPVEDVFQAAARRQSAARPAGLGKRLVARLIDTVVLGAVTAVAAVPLGTKAVDHLDDKIDVAKLSGRTETVWLLDGTTAACLGIVLAVLLLFGVLYEALPTAKWGRTLGKKLCGIEVRGIESHEPPGFGGALRRWLVYSVPGLLGIGIVGVAWCLFDRPWRQCWHDKAAHTFVAA